MPALFPQLSPIPGTARAGQAGGWACQIQRGRRGLGTCSLPLPGCRWWVLGTSEALGAETAEIQPPINGPWQFTTGAPQTQRDPVQQVQ